MDDHLVEHFEHWVETQPDAPCLIMGRRTLTYREVSEASKAFAAALRDRGIGTGHRIGVDLPVWPEWVTCLLGAARTGACVVPLNPSLSFHEFKYQLRHAEVCLAVVPQSYGDTDYLDLFDEMFEELPDLQHLVAVGDEERWTDRRVERFDDLIRNVGANGFELADYDPAATPLTTIYTPGTLGKPKGVVLSHRNLVWTALRTAEALELGSDDRILGSIPLFTIFGVHMVVSTLCTGGSIVLLERFRPGRALAAIEDQEVTVVHGVPTMFELLMRDESFDTERLRTVRTGIVAGSPVSKELAERIRTWNDVQIAYGLTETGPTITTTRFDDDDDARTQTVGRAIDGIELRLLPTEHAPTGGIGELALKGPNVMLGYYRMPQATKKSFTSDGFFRTGDLATVDDRGYVKIVGRSKLLIIRGGYNVYPQEVEDVLRTHPAVDSVIVVGIPNEILGELICGCVVHVEGAIVTADELKRYAAEQLAGYKVPDIIRFFDEFPYTDAGRVDRGAITDAAQQPTATR